MKTVDGLIVEGIKDRKLLLLRKQVLAKQQALLVNGGFPQTTNYE
jgi:hypothetical protein